MDFLRDLGFSIDAPFEQSPQTIEAIAEVIGQAPEVPDLYAPSESGPFYDGRRHLWLYNNPPSEPDGVCYYDKIPQAWRHKWADKEIAVSDFVPAELATTYPEFIRFIMSGWERFDWLAAYEPFWLYCEYSRRLQEREEHAEGYARYSQEWLDFCLGEYEHGSVCHLYALDRYVSIKDDTQPGGRRKYKASTPQALLCYLKNLGLSYALMKGRQAAITSTEMACASVRSTVIKSYSGIIVSGDIEASGKNIFEDKLKSTGKHMPPWFRPKKVPISSTTRMIYEFDGGDTKADSKLSTSELAMFSAKDTQKVNGMTPTDLYCDEAQNVQTLETLINERMPTQLAEVGGKLRVVRQTFVWGTGNVSDKGKGALERLYKGIKKQMIEGKDTQGWVALFFDGFCRPYMTESVYRAEYNRIMRQGGDGGGELKTTSDEDKRAVFSSHYPMRDEDCFMRIENTVVPYFWIRQNLDRIQKHFPAGPVRGRFAFDTDPKQPMPKGSHVDGYIQAHTIRFVPAELSDLSAPVSMFMDRKRGMVDCYIQGTDPIQSETGLSLQSSVIMAASMHSIKEEGGRVMNYPGPTCIVNGRTSSPKDIFLQTKLMGMYYANDGERACPELVEYNQGHSYIEYVQNPWMDTAISLMVQPELGPAFASKYRAGGQLPIGLVMSDDVKTALHMQMNEFHQGLASNVWYREYFMQVKNLQQEERGGGRIIKWGTSDTRKYNDDLVIAMMLAYVAMKGRYAGKVPHQITQEERMTMERRESGGNARYVMNPDGSATWYDPASPTTNPFAFHEFAA